MAIESMMFNVTLWRGGLSPFLQETSSKEMMKTWLIGDEDQDWEIIGQTKRTQAALMTIRHGDTEGGPDNKHPAADQWLYVLSGSGTAIVEGTKTNLRKGTLLLIEAGETHQITAGPRSVLKTL